MKRILTILTSAAALTLQCPAATYSSSERACSFRDNDADRTVTFIFDNALWKAGTVNSVDVRGSFNNWAKTDGYSLTYDSESSVWTVTLPYSKVRIPGNSGQPEYKFVTNGSSWQSGSGRSFIPEGYVFMTSDKNNIVIFNDDDLEAIRANSRTANTVKKAAEFDTSTREGQEEVSNFRLVPGTKKLFRCYHPFKWSRESYDSEPVRIDFVQSLSEEEGIQSDICLSGDDSGSLTSYNVNGKTYTEKVPAYYKSMTSAGHVLQVGTANGKTPSYEYVYYKSTSERFRQWVKEIVDFIIDDDTPAPFTIHCRLGTDRTGVFSAVLAALCGASWDEIAADYQKSNRMCIKEFRDYHLLQYSFEQMLGADDIHDVSDIPGGIQDYFINNGTLSHDDIAAVRAKLGAESSDVVDPTSDAMQTSDSDMPVEYYNLQGIRLDAPARGLNIRRQGTRTEKVFIP